MKKTPTTIIQIIAEKQEDEESVELNDTSHTAHDDDAEYIPKRGGNRRRHHGMLLSFISQDFIFLSLIHEVLFITFFLSV